MARAAGGEGDRLCPGPADRAEQFYRQRRAERLTGHHEGDIRDVARLQSGLAEAAPEVVFHLAAQSLVRESYARPRDTFEVNLMGTVNLLEAVRAWASLAW